MDGAGQGRGWGEKTRKETENHVNALLFPVTLEMERGLRKEGVPVMYSF